MPPSNVRAALMGLILAVSGSVASAHAQGWTPTKPVEFVVPAGTGGGADQMARVIQGVIAKHGLMKTAMVVVNKAGGAGAEGFLDVKADRGNPHKLIITLSNLFTTPLATGVPFNWRDMTPVAMLALDEFVLWVNAETPFQKTGDYLDAVRAAGPNKFKMGGTGSKQEDQIITVAIEKAAGTRFIYVPYKGGGEVATQLVGRHIDSTVNNPIEAVAQWRAGKLRPLCVLDAQRLKITDKMTETMAWSDIPACREAGLDVEYLMLRGVFMAPGVTKAQIDYYIELFGKVRATPDWQELMKTGAFNTSFMTGAEFATWLAREEVRHRELMTAAGFLAK